MIYLFNKVFELFLLIRLQESKYFCVDDLSEAIEKSLRSIKEKETFGDSVKPICRVPLVTSQKEEEVCIF